MGVIDYEPLAKAWWYPVNGIGWVQVIRTTDGAYFCHLVQTGTAASTCTTPSTQT